MKLNIKNPIISARFLLVVSVIIVLFYIVLCFIFSSKPRCDMFCEIDKTAENPNYENTIGLSLANLSFKDEKEIKDIIKKAFTGEWNYYYDGNENELDELVEDLYLAEEYLYFKEEMENKRKYSVPENIYKEDIFRFIENIKFSKPRKYQDIDDRIGIVGGDYNCYRFFLFKKVNNQWKIEKEKWPTIKYRFNEELIIQELLKQKNNEADYIIEEIDSNQNKYTNNKYKYEIQYFESEVEIVLDEFFERGTEGNPSFRIKTGGHFAVGVWDNPKNLTAKQWIDEQYLEYSGGWYGEFEKITVGKGEAYSALTTETCYIEWIIIPKSDSFYTFGVELCDKNIDDSLNTFKNVVDSFKFL